jgi:hypothetical protein
MKAKLDMSTWQGAAHAGVFLVVKSLRCEAVKDPKLLSQRAIELHLTYAK